MSLLEMFRNIKVENFRIGNDGCKKFEDSTVENNDFNEKMLNEEDVRRAIPRLQEIPFDSDRKLMSVKCKLHVTRKQFLQKVLWMFCLIDA
ncbi:MAG: hypothetical protein ACLUR5_02850 [Eubacterium ventriosum]